MNDNQDPPRWIEDGTDAPRELLGLLTADAAPEPDASRARLARVAAGVSVQLGDPALGAAMQAELGRMSFGERPDGGPSDHGTLAGAAGKGTYAGLFGALSVGAAALGLALWVAQSHSQQTSAPKPVAPQAAPRPAAELVVRPEVPKAKLTPAMAAAAATPRVAEADNGDDADDARAPRAVRKAGRPGARPQVEDPRSQDPMAELALLEQAQRALPSNPEVALALAQRHKRHFAKGQFVPEREMIAVEALFGAGRSTAAMRRGRSLLSRFPKASHVPRLKALLQSH